MPAEMCLLVFIAVISPHDLYELTLIMSLVLARDG